MSIETKYRERTPRSAEVQARAEKVMPAGETRGAVYHAPYSISLDHGAGARCWDIDGNEYIDLNNNYTCLVHGHAYPPIVEAATRAVHNGSTWAAKNVDQVELAEQLVERVPCVEQVRFTNSGSEAVLSALAVARAVTGRRKFLIARYGFHGFWLQAPTGDEASEWFEGEVAEFGDAASFESVLQARGNEIAAVLLEPILGAGGTVSAPPEFFERVKRAAHKAGALFMYDEATCFRVSTGGAQKLLGVEPDVTVLGKLIGGGFPGGGIGGRADYMRVLDPRAGSVIISGTFSGNPVTMAAGTVAVRVLTDERIAHTAHCMEQIEAMLRSAASRHGLPFSARRFGPLMSVYFSETPPVANPVREDDRLAGLFQLACLANGVFVVPRLVMNCATVFSNADLKELAQRLDAAVADVAAEA